MSAATAPNLRPESTGPTPSPVIPIDPQRALRIDQVSQLVLNVMEQTYGPKAGPIVSELKDRLNNSQEYDAVVKKVVEYIQANPSNGANAIKCYSRLLKMLSTLEKKATGDGTKKTEEEMIAKLQAEEKPQASSPIIENALWEIVTNLNKDFGLSAENLEKKKESWMQLIRFGLATIPFNALQELERTIQETIDIAKLLVSLVVKMEHDVRTKAINDSGRPPVDCMTTCVQASIPLATSLVILLVSYVTSRYFF